MKTLTVLRHAKSGWDDPVARDFDRALNARGKRAAATVGRHMRKLGMTFDHVVSSPAVRCIDTLDALWDGYGRVIHPVWERRVYLASGATLLDVVNDMPAGTQSALLCGHNPGMEDLVLSLTPDSPLEEGRDQVEEKFPTASFAMLSIEVEDWAHVVPGKAHMMRFVRPRDLDPALGPENG